MTETMKGQFVLRPDPKLARWAWSHEGGSGCGSIADVVAALGGRQATIVMPGEDVLLTSAAIPVRQRGQARLACPWALEEQLADDVDKLHFALPPTPDDGVWPIAVIARKRMDSLLEACTEAGLFPAVLIPEPLALPEPTPGFWTVMEEADRITVRTGPTSGFTTSPALLPLVVAQMELPAQFIRYRTDDAAAVTWPDNVVTQQPTDVPAQSVNPMHCLAVPVSGNGINLLQGDYDPSGRTLAQLRPWAVPLALGVLIPLLALAHLGAAYIDVRRDAANLEQSIESVFRSAMPDVERMVNPRHQLRTRLEASDPDTDPDTGFLATLNPIAGLIADHDEVTLQSIRWNDPVLELGVEAGALRAINAFQSRIDETGLSTELIRLGQRGEEVHGEIRVEASQ